jgi:plasmid maintenance system antidote protein VapI
MVQTTIFICRNGARQVLSKNLRLSRQYLSNIVNQKAGISADISMHLSKWTGQFTTLAEYATSMGFVAITQY